MGKRTNQKKDLIGSEVNYYVFNDGLITEASYFIYEVSLYKYWKNGYCFLGNRFFKANKPLSIRKSSKFKRYKDCLYEKQIVLKEAPKWFIQENNLNVLK